MHSPTNHSTVVSQHGCQAPPRGRLLLWHGALGADHPPHPLCRIGRLWHPPSHRRRQHPPPAACSAVCPARALPRLLCPAARVAPVHGPGSGCSGNPHGRGSRGRQDHCQGPRGRHPCNDPPAAAEWAGVPRLHWPQWHRVPRVALHWGARNTSPVPALKLKTRHSKVAPPVVSMPVEDDDSDESSTPSSMMSAASTPMVEEPAVPPAGHGVVADGRPARPVTPALPPAPAVLGDVQGALAAVKQLGCKHADARVGRNIVATYMRDTCITGGGGNAGCFVCTARPATAQPDDQGWRGAAPGAHAVCV